MKNILKLFAVILCTAGFFAAPSHAATFSVNFEDPLVLGMPVADETTGTVFEDVSGSNILHRSPWDKTANPQTSYTAVLANASATYEFGRSMTAFSFLWGSMDPVNSLDFYLGDVRVDTLNGAQVLGAGRGVVQGDDYVNILINAASFDSIVFISHRNSFEFANLEVAAIPLPLAMPLYGTGLVVLGLVGWRKRKTHVSQKAC